MGFPVLAKGKHLGRDEFKVLDIEHFIALENPNS
jgi:hypothetical protein